MATYHFQAMPASTVERFTCAGCGKPNRTRSFSVECTVNPFNKKPDGTPRTPAEVFRQSLDGLNDMVDKFRRHPLCRKCEGGLSSAELKEVRAKRAAA